MSNTYQMRVGPTSYGQVKNLIYYKVPNPFEVGPSGGNCTWWAWGRFWEVMAQVKTKYQDERPTPVSKSNACYFYRDGIRNGYSGGLVPKPGAIICWGYNGSPYGNPGHVAFVEKVNMAKGVVQSIEISQSGYSSGPMKNRIIYPGTGKRGSGYKFGYQNDYFNGFIYNPVDFGNPAGAVDSGYFEDEDTSTSINMPQRIAKLYRSDNFEYTPVAKREKTAAELQRDEDLANLKKYITETTFTPSKTGAISELLSGVPEQTKKDLLIKTKANFQISDALVQSPFVELNIGGYTVGSYHGTTDDYPNYISRLDIKKINGEINQYTINMIYQIRAGEDPNLLDKLFSKVRYNKISVRYGDCESGALFKDSEAVITNITANRDYASSRITYTIYATSACNYVTSIKFDFPSVNDKASNVIRDLLYNSGEKSQLLQNAFGGMVDKLFVESNNLIPTNDSLIHIEAKKNTNLLSYINYLVGCMSNVTNSVKDVIRNSSYFITYEDDINKGSYFKISEVRRTDKKSALTNNIYNITVGYPDGNDVYDFKINNNNAWSLLYENSNISNEYIYGINNNGNTTLTYSPNIISSSNILNEIQKNWWTQVTTYPISAQLVMRGLLKPINLMDYIQIDVIFYGQKHMTSGLYVVIGQQDILSGSGFYTNLNLMRVGD